LNNLSHAASLLRIRQWHKNTFVLLGFFALGDYHNQTLIVKTILIFAAFCLASSAVYIFNDYHDIDEDKAHPLKKTRPLASGAIRTTLALFTALILFLASIGISYYVNVISTFIILLYLANNAILSTILCKYDIAVN
jgi:4-hydroxybenzoate polyprenyltransferase